MLEERFPSPPLYPADAAGRARMIRFIDWFDDVWKVAPNALEAQVGREVPDVGRIDELAGRMAASLDRFEEMLAGRSYLLGDEFAAGDCAAHPFLKYAAWRDSDDDELFHRVLEGYQQLGDDHPRLAAWIARVDKRPRA